MLGDAQRCCLAVRDSFEDPGAGEMARGASPQFHDGGQVEADELHGRRFELRRVVNAGKLEQLPDVLERQEANQRRLADGDQSRDEQLIGHC